MRRGPLLLLVVLFTLPLRATSYGDFDVMPAPPWADVAAIDGRRPVPQDDVRWGIHDLLSDHQVLTGTETTHYYRIARRVLSPSGVQNASELAIDFDPSHERVVLHGVRILRGAFSVNALDPSTVRIIENEDDADQGIYDGGMRLLVFLDDVRAGDVIDYSWSLAGANPLLAGKYVDELDFSPAVPTARLRHRVTIPSGRTLLHRSANLRIEPSIAQHEGSTTYTWEQSDVAPAELEDETPAWFQPWRTVEVTEYATWGEVAGWAGALFEVGPDAVRAVTPLVEKIRNENRAPEEQMLAAVRFVQDDIRYLGIEMGRNSHEPRQPDETLTQRWGDCKDKTLLLVTLLRGLGVEAWPALVNTRLGRTLDTRLPSPFSFDHVIALVRWRGREFWIDATIASQGGTLETIDTPSPERALLVREGTSALTTIPRNSRAALRVEETYRVRNTWKSAELEIVTLYSGAQADAMRSALAAMSPRDLARERLNLAATAHPRIAASAPPAVDDERRANTITIRERYLIRDLGEQWFYRARDIESYAVPPLTVIRSMPLAIEHPLDLTQVVSFILPGEVDVKPASALVETPALRMHYSRDRNGNAIVLRYRLQSTADSVPPHAVAEHVGRLDDIQQLAVFEIPRRIAVGAQDSRKWIWGTLAAGLFLAVCAVAVLPRRKNRKATVLPTRPGFAPGEAPSSAIRVHDTDELAIRAGASVCRCGFRTNTGGDLQQARYGDDDILILTRSCNGCGSEQSIYFALTSPRLRDSARSA